MLSGEYHQISRHSECTTVYCIFSFIEFYFFFRYRKKSRISTTILWQRYNLRDSVVWRNTQITQEWKRNCTRLSHGSAEARTSSRWTSTKNYTASRSILRSNFGRTWPSNFIGKRRSITRSFCPTISTCTMDRYTWSGWKAPPPISVTTCSIATFAWVTEIASLITGQYCRYRTLIIRFS